MSEGERFGVYLPSTAAKAVREAREAGRKLNLSEAAARGIMQALNGSEHQALDQAQLDRIEKLVTELHELERQRHAQDDRADWTTRDWIRADSPKGRGGGWDHARPVRSNLGLNASPEAFPHVSSVCIACTP